MFHHTASLSRYFTTRGEGMYREQLVLLVLGIDFINCGRVIEMQSRQIFIIFEIMS